MINKVSVISRVLLAILFIVTCCSALAQVSAEKQLPPDSIYHFKSSLKDQSAATINLDHYQGQPTIISLFYASCPHVCPLIISTIKLNEGILDEQQRSQLRVLMISIDPERDTPDVLLATMKRHAVDAERWSMARPEATDVRAIAGILGIKYKQLPDGEFNHSSKLILLDGDGVPLTSTSQIGRLDDAFVKALKTSLQ